MQLDIGDIVEMRKKHPCGSSLWTVTRVGADIKIKCRTCERVVMLARPDFEKRVKRVIERAGENRDAE